MSFGDISAIARPQVPVGPRESQKELKAAAAEFESLFINQMLKNMRDTVVKSELFHGGNAEEIYTSMLDTELSKSMANSGGIGLADMLLRQFSGAGNEAASEPVGAKAANKSSGVEAPAAPAVSAPVEEQKGLSFPLRELKRISSGFGPRKDPFTGKSRFHHGLDIAAEKGTPVFAAAPGKVVFSGPKGGYGNLIEVLHEDGVVTRYGHNAENLVKEGDIVGPSEPIARVGSTGRSTGPHLHFEILKDGKALDPDTFYG